MAGNKEALIINPRETALRFERQNALPKHALSTARANQLLLLCFGNILCGLNVIFGYICLDLLLKVLNGLNYIRTALAGDIKDQSAQLRRNGCQVAALVAVTVYL